VNLNQVLPPNNVWSQRIHKIGIFNCTGIWVNANTGEVNYVEVDKNQNFHTDPNIWLTSYNGNKHNEE